MPNGTVSRIVTHIDDQPVPISRRKQAIMHAAVRIIVPTGDGNAVQQLKRRK